MCGLYAPSYEEGLGGSAALSPLPLPCPLFSITTTLTFCFSLRHRRKGRHAFSSPHSRRCRGRCWAKAERELCVSLHPRSFLLQASLLIQAQVFCRRAQWTKIASLVADEKTGLEMRDARSRSGPVGMHTKVRRCSDLVCTPLKLAHAYLQMILGTLRGPPDADADPGVTDSDTETDDDDSSIVEIVEEDDEKGKPYGWLYIGSHNFTPSAWGTLSGNAFNPMLNVRFYSRF